ncbi:hypothetical protein ACFT5C_18400 [Streptomyces sp. NPDC057116]|uniref:hypothetical protein n=1 Tax=Streptomyces sp. NPDC057116 TaxID=3346023 RepID=UPI00363A1FAE
MAVLGMGAGGWYLYAGDDGYRMDGAVCQEPGLPAVTRTVGDLRLDGEPEEQSDSGTGQRTCTYSALTGTGDAVKDVLVVVKIHIRQEGAAQDPGGLMVPPDSRRVAVDGVGEKAYAVSAFGNGYQGLVVLDRNAAVTVEVTGRTVQGSLDLSTARPAMIDDARGLLAALEG